MDTTLAVVCGALIGAAITFALMRTYCQNVAHDRHLDAYEEGWTNGYDVGVKAPRPKRVKTIRKADT